MQASCLSMLLRKCRKVRRKRGLQRTTAYARESLVQLADLYSPGMCTSSALRRKQRLQLQWPAARTTAAATAAVTTRTENQEQHVPLPQLQPSTTEDKKHQAPKEPPTKNPSQPQPAMNNRNHNNNHNNNGELLAIVL